MADRVITYDEQVVPGKRLGRHVEHDARSMDFPFEAGRAVKIVKVLHPRRGVIFDQGDIGSCTGNAVAGCLNTSPEIDLRNVIRTEVTAVNLYSLATHLDRIKGVYPPDDTGSSGLAAAKAAQQEGMISGYRHCFGAKHALEALMAGPVITGVPWFEGFDHPDENGVVKIAGQIRGGHEFEVLGYDPDLDHVVAANSWGPEWGKDGYFIFTSKTWAQLLDNMGDVTVLVP